MDIKTQAFLDEMHKIAEDRAFVTKDRVLRALQSGLVAAGGMGLGWGLGNLVSDTVLPRALNKMIPNPSVAQLQKGMLIAGGLGSVGSLAMQLMKQRALKHVADGDHKQQDYLMGHDELNPPSIEATE